jgi:endonuclease-3
MENTNRFDTLKKIPEVIKRLRKGTQGMIEPMSLSIVQKYGRDPFLVVVSCLLSSRTKDTVTLPASIRLFSLALTPEGMYGLSLEEVERAIYPVGFYHQKAHHIKKLCFLLVSHYQGKVPADFTALTSLPGVGPKTANLVLGIGFGIPALCVDVHVHRIANRLGLVATTTPQETEKALKLIVSPDYWIELNRLLVMWGQNICVPVSPYCSRCVVRDVCPRKGVTRSR